MSVDLNALELQGLEGDPVPEDALGGKVLLFVNVASRCGFTSQYTGLQALYERYQEQGLEVVGVPCNQFGAQEPGTPAEIRSFCSTKYNVTFPILAKQDVNGSGRSALYRALIGDGDEVRWNFEKFLVGQDGEVLGRWGSRTTPESEELIQAIEAAL